MSTVAETATLAHGYTMADVDKIALRAATRSWLGSYNTDERQNAAWFAVVELLYSSTEKPAHVDVLNAASSAARRSQDDQSRHHGIDHGQEMPAVSKYWLPIMGSRGDFSDHVAERLALPQVLGALTGDEYEALVALAAFDNDNGLAALSIGLSDSAFRARIAKARRRINVAWYAPETPRDTSQRKLTPDGTCKYGHNLSEHGVTKGDRLRCSVCMRRTNRKAMANARTRAKTEAYADDAA